MREGTRFGSVRSKLGVFTHIYFLHTISKLDPCSPMTMTLRLPKGSKEHQNGQNDACHAQGRCGDGSRSSKGVVVNWKWATVIGRLGWNCLELPYFQASSKPRPGGVDVVGAGAVLGVLEG